MFAGRTLIDYTSLFYPYDFEKNETILLLFTLKMNKYSSIETTNTPSLSD